MRKIHQYGKVDRFLHWLIALNIFGTLIFSYGMSALPDEQKVVEYGNHGLSVTSIFIFMSIRLVWRIYKGFPLLPDNMSDLQKFAAKCVHYFLYIAIFCQIIIGILLASTTNEDFIAMGYGINYSAFDLLSDGWYEQMLVLHKTGYWVIVTLIAVHILAALKHHFVDKDDVLHNMLPFRKR